VLTKLYPTRSHTGAAQGGMCAALANVEEDNWEWHTFDTVKGGDYLVDQDAAEVMCKEAIDAVLDLEKMGLPFNRTPEGRIDQRRFGGHTRNHGEAAVRRSCFAADRTGHMILQTLYQQCVKHEIDFFNEFYVLDLLLTEVDGEQVDERRRGVRARDRRPARLPHQGVLFATGGFGKVFKVTSNAHTLTGDGMGIAYRKGLPLEDMEFYQFHPTGIWKMGILLSEAARGEGGILRNKDGERFMERYAPTIKDLAPRDMVARAIYSEIRQGRGCGPERRPRAARPHHLPPEVIDAKLPDITEFARTYLGVEPYTEGIPIQPTRTTPWAACRPTSTPRCCATTRRRARACSPPARSPACRCTAPTARHQLAARHQRLRPPRRAVGRGLRQLGRLRRPAGHPERETLALLQRLKDGGGTELVAKIRDELQDTMDANASVYRTEATLKQAEVDIAGLKERYLRVGRRRPRQALQHRAARGRRAGLPARPGRVPGRVGQGPQRVARRPLPRGLPDARRRQLHAPHHGVQGAGRLRAASASPRTCAWTTSRSCRPATSRWNGSTR
jgi:succinate dehydrogenase / fumarate reductase flavoprotein subunit